MGQRKDQKQTPNKPILIGRLDTTNRDDMISSINFWICHKDFGFEDTRNAP